MNILPKPKLLQQKEGFLLHKTIHIATPGLDTRILKALEQLPRSQEGAALEVQLCDMDAQSYSLEITQHKISVKAGSDAGAFYGIQTLRQIFTHDQIPCLYIEDKPDFAYRGFYHDITRGRVPTVDAVKKLIDEMAYYKMNSLQLYVEHTFAFRELSDVTERTGCLTAEEIKELDDYCYERFIEFIPSIATFGHLYELLQKEEYKALCVLENYEPEYFVWVERMRHHTIDPVNPKSFSLVKSMIDQYLPLFRSDKFNICGDETFDLGEGRHKNDDSETLYVDFITKLTEYLQSKGKTVMMWADILLKHPKAIERLPEGIEYLNWCYATDVNEASMEVFQKLGKTQIVCPGTQSWATLCPDITHAEINICKMTELGYQHGAVGVLNTNWGDYGHPCSLGMCMYPMVLGAVKAWSVDTKIDEVFENSIDHLLFQTDNALELLRRLSSLQLPESWSTLTCWYSNAHCRGKLPVPIPAQELLIRCQKGCRELLGVLKEQKWGVDSYREEMMIAAEGMQVIAETFAQIAGYPIKRSTSTEKWLEQYKKKWRQESKESELGVIEALFQYAEHNAVSS